jgi:hypothetical protein
MGMPFPGGPWVKSLPRGVSLERPSGSMLRRRERKLSQQETWDYVDEEMSSIPNRKDNQQSILIPVVVVVVVISSNRGSDSGSRICEVVVKVGAVLLQCRQCRDAPAFDFPIGCEQGEWKISAHFRYPFCKYRIRPVTNLGVRH